jgi:hypothetical protein
MKGREKRLVSVVLAITAVVALAFLPDILRAESKEAGAPVITSPEEFVKENLQTFEETLTALKKRYEACCGSVLTALSGAAVDELAKRLPRAVTLKLRVEYPKPEEMKEEKPRIEPGKYFVRGFRGMAEMSPFHEANRQYFGQSEDFLVAGDKVTAEILGLPEKVRLNPWVDTLRIEKGGNQIATCCTAFNINDGVKSCSAYALLPGMTFVDNVSAFAYSGVIKLRVSTKGGVTEDPPGRYSFSGAGLKSVEFSSLQKLSYEDDHRVSYESGEDRS